MKRLVFDLDGTLAHDDPSVGYASARNMRTYDGQFGKIKANTLPVIVDWLARHDVPHDELHVGKPWCGTDGFYIDDKAVRPSEFLALSHAEIRALLAREA